MFSLHKATFAFFTCPSKIRYSSSIIAILMCILCAAYPTSVKYLILQNNLSAHFAHMYLFKLMLWHLGFVLDWNRLKLTVLIDCKSSRSSFAFWTYALNIEPYINVFIAKLVIATVEAYVIRIV